MKALLKAAVQSAPPDRVSLIAGCRYELLTKETVYRIIDSIEGSDTVGMKRFVISGDLGRDTE